MRTSAEVRARIEELENEKTWDEKTEYANTCCVTELEWVLSKRRKRK